MKGIENGSERNKWKQTDNLGLKFAFLHEPWSNHQPEASERNEKQVKRWMQNLKDCSLFKALTQSEIRSVLEACDEISYADGEFVVRQGGDPEYFYILMHGHLCAAVDAGNGSLHVVHHFKKGDYFGEQAILEHGKRTSSVLAEGRVAEKLGTLGRQTRSAARCLRLSCEHFCEAMDIPHNPMSERNETKRATGLVNRSDDALRELWDTTVNLYWQQAHNVSGAEGNGDDMTLDVHGMQLFFVAIGVEISTSRLERAMVELRNLRMEKLLTEVASSPYETVVSKLQSLDERLQELTGMLQRAPVWEQGRKNTLRANIRDTEQQMKTSMAQLHHHQRRYAPVSFEQFRMWWRFGDGLQFCSKRAQPTQAGTSRKPPHVDELAQTSANARHSIYGDRSRSSFVGARKHSSHARTQTERKSKQERGSVRSPCSSHLATTRPASADAIQRFLGIDF